MEYLLQLQVVVVVVAFTTSCSLSSVEAGQGALSCTPWLVRKDAGCKPKLVKTPKEKKLVKIITRTGAFACDLDAPKSYLQLMYLLANLFLLKEHGDKLPNRT